MTKNLLSKLTTKQLKRAAAIRKKIEAIEKELNQIWDSTAAAPVTVARPGKRNKSAVAATARTVKARK